MKNIIVICLISSMLTTTVFISNVYADNPVIRTDMSISRKMAKKFSRGFANVVTGPGELIKQPFIESNKADSIVGVAAGCMSGVFTGIGWMFYRVGTGILDIITFPVPINDYETLIEPEFII